MKCKHFINCISKWHSTNFCDTFVSLFCLQLNYVYRSLKSYLAYISLSLYERQSSYVWVSDTHSETGDTHLR